MIIGLFMLAWVAYGIYETTKLPIDAVPDITDNQVQVITIAPSFGATDIERLVTFPIEQANSNINGIKEIRSFSRFGLSLVTIVFDDKTDIYWARQQVAERLQVARAAIPSNIGAPELGPITTGLGEIYQYTIRAKEGYQDTYNDTELRTIQDWIVRRQLLGVEGVAEVSSFGGKLKQYEVAVNTDQLNANHVTIQEVFDAIERNNQNTGGAYIEKNASVLFIRSEGLISSVSELESIAIKLLDNGTPLHVSDVAEVRIGHGTRYGAMTYNDEGEVAGAVVMMLKGANSSEVVNNVKERITEIQKTLPEGVVIEPFLDRTKMVDNAIGTVEENLMLGALIVVFILVVFLGNIRAGLLVASVIPLSFLFAIILMNAFGVSGNLMSLGALDFGLIVDGAVIIVEAVLHQLTHSKKYKDIKRLGQDDFDTEVKTAAGKMMNSAVFGQIIILIVYLPIFTLEGVEGKLFKPMAQTVAFALLGAFILSLTYVPMMSAFVLNKKIKHKPGFSDKLMFRLERFYQHALEVALNKSKIVLVGVLGLFILSIVVLTQMGGEFIPVLEEGDFAVDTRVLTGSSLQTTIDNTQKAAGILKARFPEVEQVVTKIGSGEVPTDPMPIEASDMMVILKDKSEWTSAKTFDELAAKMSTALEEIPGITTGFQYPVQMRFNELMTGARQDVVCKIFGENLDTLAHYAKQLGDIINTIDGAQDLYIEPVTGMPQIVVDYNRDKLAQYGLSVDEVNATVNTAFAGQATGALFEGEKRFDIVVKLASENRSSLDDVRNLLIGTGSGQQIPLHQIAEVDIKDSPYQIQREDAKRRIVVGFNVRNTDVQTVVSELQKKSNAQLEFNPGYYLTYGGAFENLELAKKRLSIAVPVALLLILLMLYFAFGSLKHGLLIFSAIPLSAIGGILLLSLRGLPFSISAGIGFIALFGVAVLNGIVLIAEFNRLRNEGLHDLRRVVLMGTKVRLRPVLMTALVASLGFLPMAISNGSGAEVQRPLATVVIGGLLIATFLTLFVLPILYIIFEGKKHKPSTMTEKISMVCILVILGTTAKAQQPISLQAALDSAAQLNAQVQVDQYHALAKQSLVKSAVQLPGTDLMYESGQMNSVYRDTKWSVSQSFDLPIQYIHQKKLLQAEAEQAQVLATITIADVQKEITHLYYQILVSRQRLQVLQQADSLYTEFITRMELTLNVGAISELDLASGRNKQLQTHMQLQDETNRRNQLIVQFNYLLNCRDAYIPATDSMIIQPFIPDYNTGTLLAKLGNQWIKQAEYDWLLSKSALLPSLSLGYMNSSMQGVGADDQYYDKSVRFSAFQVGISLPLNYVAKSAEIQAASLMKNQANLAAYQANQEVQTQKQMAIMEADVLTSALSTYLTTGLPNIQSMYNAAHVQLQTGEVNYFTWLFTVNQALDMQLYWLDMVDRYNAAHIQLQYFTH